ncbi:MAG: polysaccharide biosynthesis protein [Pseudomonadota bacterium]
MSNSDQRQPANGPADSRSPLQRYATLLGVSAWDALAGAAAMYGAIVVRYLFEPSGHPPGGVEWVASGLFAIACLLVLPLMGLHRGLWRHTTLADAGRLFQGIVLAHLVFLPALFLFTRLQDFPRSALLMSTLAMVVATLGPRLAATAWRSGDLRALFRIEDRKTPAAVLVGGAERMAEVLRREMRRSGGPSFRFRALIEPGGAYRGRALLGVPVLGGMEALEDAARRVARDGETVRIVLAEADPPSELIAECARVAGRVGATLSRSRAREGGAPFTAVEAADLLSRTPRHLSRAGARKLIAGKRVLVTGAGGAIGSELTRQAAQLDPERLILLDSAESHLYEIDMALKATPDAPDWRAVLGDVRDVERLKAVFAQERPEVILHAAALKHVPLMEVNGAEAVLTNVFGTQNVVDAAALSGCEVVVLISTDKAVDPVSIMGATKRAAELYLAAAAQDLPAPRLCAVRFGNVLASTGSVVPLFERQISEGGPVTVTDPDTTRYFMTLEEAASLVLEAGAQTAEDAREDGRLFLLDMGQPVPIARLARQLIRLRGMEPGRDIGVEYMGLRPGEKLHEALTHAFEDTRPSATDGVLRVSGPRPQMEALRPALERLKTAALARDEAGVRSGLDEILALGWPAGVQSMAERLSAG